VTSWLLGLAFAAGGDRAQLTLVGEEMIVGATALALPVATAAGDDRGLSLVALVPAGAAVGGGVGLWASRAREPSEGQAMAWTTSQLGGAAHGIGWGYAAGLGAEAGWLGLGGLAAGSLVGGQLAATRPSAGEVAVVRAGLLWGGLAGVAARFIDPRDRPTDVATVLVASDVGLVAGLLVAAQPGSPSRDQVARVQLAGLGGAGAGLAVGLGLQGAGVGNERTPFAGAALGAAAGLGLGVAKLSPLAGEGAVAVAPTAEGGVQLCWSAQL